MAIRTYGLMGVDWEERVNFERLRNERLARIKKLLKESEVGAAYHVGLRLSGAPSSALQSLVGQ